jgi:cyclase
VPSNLGATSSSKNADNKNLRQLSNSTYAYVFHEVEDIANAGIVVTDEGVVVIDNDMHTVDQLFATLPKLTDKPVTFLINTHHAFDHTSANCIFARKGVTIVAAKRCREEMVRLGEFNFKRWADRVPSIKKAIQERELTVAVPNLTFDHELQLNLGGETIELFYFGHAHTPGDIVVYLPKDQILFGGDLFLMDTFPSVREAIVPNQIKVIDRILEFPVKYYVPGHGRVTTDRNDVKNWRDYVNSMYERIERMFKEGRNIEEIKALEPMMIKEHPAWEGRRLLHDAFEEIYQFLTRTSANSAK